MSPFDRWRSDRVDCPTQASLSANWRVHARGPALGSEPRERTIPSRATSTASGHEAGASTRGPVEHAPPRRGVRIRAPLAASRKAPPLRAPARSTTSKGNRLSDAERTFATPTQRAAEKQMAAQAETAYLRLMADWQPIKKSNAGASATPGRESIRPSKGKAARQTQ